MKTKKMDEEEKAAIFLGALMMIWLVFTIVYLYNVPAEPRTKEELCQRQQHFFKKATCTLEDK